MNAVRDNSTPPRWLTWWAYLTVASVLPLLFLGALVTSMKVGMADQRSVVSPWEALNEIIFGEQSLGWKIEHAHRLTGWFAGICGIGLAIGFWLRATGRFRWLGLLGLVLIGAQGLLGIFRVKLNALWGTDLAWIHGISAQVVFAALAGIALMASPGWRFSRSRIRQNAGGVSQASGVSPHSGECGYAGLPAPALRRWSLICVGLVFAQLVLGGVIRHQPGLLMARVHILGAFLVLAGLLWLARLTFDACFRLSGWLILGLVALEIILGVETAVHWMARFFVPAFEARETMGQLLTRTTHYFVGSLVFAVTTIVAVQAHRSALVSRDAQRSAEVPPVADVSVPVLAGQSLQGGIA